MVTKLLLSNTTSSNTTSLNSEECSDRLDAALYGPPPAPGETEASVQYDNSSGNTCICNMTTVMATVVFVVQS